MFVTKYWKGSSCNINKYGILEKFKSSLITLGKVSTGMSSVQNEKIKALELCYTIKKSVLAQESTPAQHKIFFLFIILQSGRRYLKMKSG